MTSSLPPAPTLIEQARQLRGSLQRAVGGDFYINEEYRDQLLVESGRLLGDFLTALEQAREALNQTSEKLRKRGEWLKGTADAYEAKPWGGHIRANVLYDYRFFGSKLIEDADALAALGTPATPETKG
jgi:hypothetical protein